MRSEHLDEPELEFGGGQRHIDVRFGLTNYGPLDADAPTARHEIRVGIVGTPVTVDGVTRWLRSCRDGVAAKRTKLPNLFPRFPGFSRDSPFGCDLVLDKELCAEVLPAGIDRANLPTTVDRFIEASRQLIDNVQPDVIICAPPDHLSPISHESDIASTTSDVDLDVESNEGSGPDGASEPGPVGPRHGGFHDLLKARGLFLSAPMQMVWPATYGGIVTSESEPRSLQDEATRAWNFHVALYYKAGGTPWRIARDATDYTSCFVGVAFYRSDDDERLLTSMAQLFNARGDGVIVRGGPARYEKADRQVHMSEADARTLLANALRTYRREHHTAPARVVVHKTSRFDAAERSGMRRAITDEKISSLELLSLHRTETRLFRRDYYPPLRGTMVTLDQSNVLLYLRGSVPFYATWPGLYVPRPQLIHLDDVQGSPRNLAREVLALSKQNWNDTQFDGGKPITLDAAGRVGDIMRHVPTTGLEPQARYAFYM